MPTDVVTGRMMCSITLYEPWDFNGSEDGSILYWVVLIMEPVIMRHGAKKVGLESQFEDMRRTLWIKDIRLLWVNMVQTRRT